MDDWWINRPQPWHLKCYRLTHTHCTWDWRSDFEKKYLTSLRAKCCWFSASHSGDFHQTRYVKALHHVEWLLGSPKKTQCYIKPHSGHEKKYKTHLLPTQERQERAVAVSSRISSPHWFVLKLKWRLREGIVVVNKAPVISLEGLFFNISWCHFWQPSRRCGWWLTPFFFSLFTKHLIASGNTHNTISEPS